MDLDDAVELSVRIGAQLAPALDGRVPVRGSERTPFQIRERGLVRGDHPGTGAPLDRHVADRHPALHRELLDRLARVLDRVADAAVHADLADRAEDHVLRGQAGRQLADELDFHRLRAALRQRLRGKHVLDLGGADPERERAERAVRGRDVHARQHDRRRRRLGLEPETGQWPGHGRQRQLDLHLHPLVGDGQLLHRHVGALGVERPADVLDDARPQEVPRLDGAAVVLLRLDGRIDAISARCSHAGGPLHEGEVVDGSCVQCPWHGSVFAMADTVAMAWPLTTPAGAGTLCSQ